MNKHLSLFFKSLFYQLSWFIPLILIGGYIHAHLPDWCDSYFGVTEMQKTIPSPTSTSSTSLLNSFGSFMMETAISAKVYMLSSVSTLIAHLGQLILDIFGFILLWKLIKKLHLSYSAKTRDSDLIQAVVAQLRPEITALRQEVAHLATLINRKEKNK